MVQTAELAVLSSSRGLNQRTESGVIMVIGESLETNNIISGAIEAPRYSCALGGAYSTAVGILGVVPPILHSGGAGCGIGQLFGQFYGGGQNAGGPLRRDKHSLFLFS